MWAVLDLSPRKEIVLSPKAYLELRESNPGAIKRAVMIPPRIGNDKHFGKIRVTLKKPRLEDISKRFF